MEGFWLQDLLRNVARDPSTVMTLADLVDPIPYDPETEDGHKDEDAHAHDDDEDGHGHDDDDEHEDDEDGHADDEENGHDEDEGHDDDEDAEHEDDENGHAHDDDDEHEDEEDEHGHEDEHDHGTHDPHFWFDPLRVMIAIDAIAARFAEIDPEHADEYRANAAAYNAELLALHTWTLEQVSTVPEGQRLIVGSHDYYGYFAARYGFQILGIILSIAEGSEPSAEHLAHLVELIHERNVKAVFGEMIALERLASALANEANVPLVRLYADDIGPEGSGAETYIAMVRYNVSQVVEALR